MANVVSGNTVSSAAQLNADVVTASAIKDGEVKSAEILDESILTSDIKDGEIVNADISASAGIVDTKLAEIGTANKVNGTSFKNLAGIPAGAGVIPNANLPGIAMTLLQASSGASTNTGANALDTVAISGLTAKDSLLIFYEYSAITQPGAIVSIRNTTDSVDMTIPNGNLAIAVGKSNGGVLMLKQQQHSNVNIMNICMEGGANTIATATVARTAGVVTTASTPVTTAWTGNWNLALYSIGVTAGGTMRWSWSVYKVNGQ